MFVTISEGVDSMGKGSFILYDNDMKSLEYLTDAQIGKLFKAIAKYRIDGTKTNLGKNPALNILFDQIIDHIKINEDKYKEMCEKNSERAKKRWHQPNNSMPAYADACGGMPAHTGACLNDNDNDNVNDNVNVNEVVACGAKKENKRNNYYKRKNDVPALLRDEPSYDIDAFMKKALNLKYKPPETTPSSESG